MEFDNDKFRQLQIRHILSWHSSANIKTALDRVAVSNQFEIRFLIITLGYIKTVVYGTTNHDSKILKTFSKLLIKKSNLIFDKTKPRGQ